MDKHTKKTPSLFRYPVLVAFGLFFIGLFVLDMATPDRAYSELENTTLTQRPRLTAVSADGLNNYFTSYTRYVKDQVFGRDQWISLQSAAEMSMNVMHLWRSISQRSENIITSPCFCGSI